MSLRVDHGLLSVYDTYPEIIRDAATEAHPHQGLNEHIERHMLKHVSKTSITCITKGSEYQPLDIVTIQKSCSFPCRYRNSPARLSKMWILWTLWHLQHSFLMSKHWGDASKHAFRAWPRDVQIFGKIRERTFGLRYKPLIFNDGVQIPFPAPTRTLYKASHRAKVGRLVDDLEDVNAGQSRHQKSAPTAIVKHPRRQGIIRWLHMTHAGTRVKRKESLCKCKHRISTYLHL